MNQLRAQYWLNHIAIEFAAFSEFSEFSEFSARATCNVQRGSWHVLVWEVWEVVPGERAHERIYTRPTFLSILAKCSVLVLILPCPAWEWGGMAT